MNGGTKSPQAQTPTILLVDDENDIRELMAVALERSGFNVLKAASGEEARVIWEKMNTSISLLLVDILMPGMSGPEIVREFRSQRPDLKIIFASGNSHESVVDTAHTVRGAIYLLKPFPIQKLLEVVRATIAAD